MATLTQTRTVTLCDRCERPCGKGSGRAVLTHNGVVLVPEPQHVHIDEGDERSILTVSLDLCKPCIEALYGFWRRRQVEPRREKKL